MSDLVEGKRIFLLQSYHVRPDKKIVPVEDTCPIYDKHGVHIGIVGIIRDVTETKKIENELKNSRDFLERIFQTSLEGIIVGDAQGYTTMVNNAATAMLRYSKDEIIGKHPTALFTPLQRRPRRLRQRRR